MVQIENVKMLITGIVLLIVPILVFYINFVEDMWEGTDYDWIGTLGTLTILGLALWAIREGLTSPPKNASARNPLPSTPSLHHRSQFCIHCGTPRQPIDKFCGACGKQFLSN